MTQNQRIGYLLPSFNEWHVANDEVTFSDPPVIPCLQPSLHIRPNGQWRINRGPNQSTPSSPERARPKLLRILRCFVQISHSAAKVATRSTTSTIFLCCVKTWRTIFLCCVKTWRTNCDDREDTRSKMFLSQWPWMWGNQSRGQTESQEPVFAQISIC